MELFTPGHLIIVAIVAVVLFFGWKQLPDMARSLGRSLRVFKTEIKGMSEDDKAREAAKSEPAAIEPVRTAQSADVLANPSIGAGSAHNGVASESGALGAEPARTRPRPAPNPNGHRAPAKSE